MVFEMRVLRRIYGPTEERDGTWWSKFKENIINYIKAQITSLVWTRASHGRW